MFGFRSHSKSCNISSTHPFFLDFFSFFPENSCFCSRFLSLFCFRFVGFCHVCTFLCRSLSISPSLILVLSLCLFLYIFLIFRFSFLFESRFLLYVFFVSFSERSEYVPDWCSVEPFDCLAVWKTRTVKKVKWGRISTFCIALK